MLFPLYFYPIIFNFHIIIFNFILYLFLGDRSAEFYEGFYWITSDYIIRKRPKTFPRIFRSPS